MRPLTLPATMSPDLAITFKLLATRSIESPCVNRTSCSDCSPLDESKEMNINTGKYSTCKECIHE